MPIEKIQRMKTQRLSALPGDLKKGVGGSGFKKLLEKY